MNTATQATMFKSVKPAAKYITLNDWTKLSDTDRQQALATNGKSKFNRTNDNVEWSSWTWNPVTGCLHNCPYCYARDIAQRFYRDIEGDRFQPVLRPARLNAPAITKQPDLSNISDPVRKMALKNVFVCSMADLFGKWTPTEWIKAVLQQVRDNPQWNFLFLTKFPIRMSEFEYPSNAWLGTSVDKQHAVKRAEKAFLRLRENGYSGVAWLSCEPMLERLTFTNLSMFDWVVIGGASKSTQTETFYPPNEWINSLESQARQAGCKIYEKTNLRQAQAQRIREYPTI